MEQDLLKPVKPKSKMLDKAKKRNKAHVEVTKKELRENLEESMSSLHSKFA